MQKRLHLSELPHLSIDDIFAANCALDAWEAAEARAHEKARREAEARGRSR